MTEQEEKVQKLYIEFQLLNQQIQQLEKQNEALNSNLMELMVTNQSLDEIKKLGLTLDQYLSSTGKTAEMLRLEAEGKAANDLKLEFTLRKVADSEKITVSDADLENTIGKAKTSEEKQNLQANKYLLASILRQQKTLDFLRSL